MFARGVVRKLWALWTVQTCKSVLAILSESVWTAWDLLHPNRCPPCVLCVSASLWTGRFNSSYGDREKILLSLSPSRLLLRVSVLRLSKLSKAPQIHHVRKIRLLRSDTSNIFVPRISCSKHSHPLGTSATSVALFRSVDIPQPNLLLMSASCQIVPLTQGRQDHGCLSLTFSV